MHSYHRNNISTVEEWLSLFEEEEEDQDPFEQDFLNSTGIYPVQRTALLYRDETICQEEM